MKQQNVNNTRHLIGPALLPGNKDVCQRTAGTRPMATCSLLLQVFMRKKLHYELSHLPAVIASKALILTFCRPHLLLAPQRCWARLERWHKSWRASHVGMWEESARRWKWHHAGAGGRRLQQEKQPAAGCRKMWDSAAPRYLTPYLLTISHGSHCRFPCYPVLVAAASICLWWGTPLQSVKSDSVANRRLSFCGRVPSWNHWSHPRCRQPPHPVSHPQSVPRACGVLTFRAVTFQHPQLKHWLMEKAHSRNLPERNAATVFWFASACYLVIMTKCCIWHWK